MATKTVTIDCVKTNAIFAIRTCKESGISVGLRFSKNEAHQNHVKIATAVLGSGDKFSHKKGRNIIMARFDEGAFIVLPYASISKSKAIEHEENINFVFDEITLLLAAIS